MFPPFVCFSYDTAQIPCGFSDEDSAELREYGLLVNEQNCHKEAFLEEYEKSKLQLMQTIACSSYLHHTDGTTEESPSLAKETACHSCNVRDSPREYGDTSQASNGTTCHNNATILDLRAFVEENKSAILPKGYDENLQLVNGKYAFMMLSICILYCCVTMENGGNLSEMFYKCHLHSQLQIGETRVS